jgi:hypothetical protein
VQLDVQHALLREHPHALLVQRVTTFKLAQLLVPVAASVESSRIRWKMFAQNVFLHVLLALPLPLAIHVKASTVSPTFWMEVLAQFHAPLTNSVILPTTNAQIVLMDVQLASEAIF